MAQNKYMAQSLYDEKKAAKKASSARTSGRAEPSEDPKLRSEFQRYKRDTEIELEELRRRGSPATGTGTPGKDGKDGVGIRSVTQEVVSEESGGENVVAVELTDSSSYRFTVRNGKQGEKGDAGLPGAKGDKGDKGDAGKDGTSVTIASVSTSTEDGGSNVVTFSDGNTVTVKNGSKGDKGDTGATGADGKNGADGKTPVRGTDYWTDSDIASMKSYLETVILNGEW